MAQPLLKLLALGVIGVYICLAATPDGDLSIRVELEDVPRILQFFETCYLQVGDPPKRDRPVQQFVSNNSDATVKIKGHLMRLPENNQPVQYLDLDFWFLINAPLSEDSHMLWLVGKCFSLMIMLERDHSHSLEQDRGANFAYDLDEVTGNKTKPSFSVKRLLFNNEKKSGFCVVDNPNLGSLKPAEEHLSCPSEQMFACRRTQLTDEEKANDPNKFDVLVIEHLEFGFDSHGEKPTGRHLSKKMKKCDLV